MNINSVKEFFDLITSAFLLLMLAPLVALLSLILLAYNRGNIFFIQTRIGKNERPYRVFKFKTMNDEVDPDGALLSDEQRCTKLGKWLRAVHLDELPNLLNVLKGEMSLVGPRPLLPEYLDLYSEEERKRHEVKPGITGLAQIKGGNSLSWNERFYWDLYYVENQCFTLDLKILFITFFHWFFPDPVFSPTLKKSSV